jgi:hypothetical protein
MDDPLLIGTTPLLQVGDPPAFDIGGNPPSITYAGGSALYAQQKANVVFNDIQTLGTITFVNPTTAENVLSVNAENTLLYNGVVIQGAGEAVTSVTAGANLTGGGSGPVVNLAVSDTPSFNTATLVGLDGSALITPFIEASAGGGLNIISTDGDLQMDAKSNNLNLLAGTGAISIFNDFTSGIAIGVDGSISQPVLSLSAALNLGASANVTIENVSGEVGQVIIANGDGTVSWGANGGGGGAVASVSGGDANITVSPTTGAVIVTLASSIDVNQATVSNLVLPTGSISLVASSGSAGNVITADGDGACTWQPIPTAPVTSVDSGDNNIVVDPTTGDVVVSLSTAISVASIAVTDPTITLGVSTGSAGQLITADGLGNCAWAEPAVISVSATGSNIVCDPTTGEVGVGLADDITVSSVNTGGLTVTGSLTADASTGSAGQVLTSTGTGVEWASTVLLSGLAQIGPGGTGFTEYWIIVGPTAVNGVTTSASVTATLQIPDGTSQNWIVNADPIIVGGIAYIHVVFASLVADDAVVVSWCVNSLSNVASNMLTSEPI